MVCRYSIAMDSMDIYLFICYQCMIRHGYRIWTLQPVGGGMTKRITNLYVM